MWKNVNFSDPVEARFVLQGRDQLDNVVTERAVGTAAPATDVKQRDEQHEREQCAEQQQVAGADESDRRLGGQQQTSGSAHQGSQRQRLQQ